MGFVDQVRIKYMSIRQTEYPVGECDIATVTGGLKRIGSNKAEQRLVLRILGVEERSPELIIFGDLVIDVDVELILAELRRSADGRQYGAVADYAVWSLAGDRELSVGKLRLQQAQGAGINRVYTESRL